MTKVLVVEDEQIVAKDIEFSLSTLGYIVAGIVATGEDAVKFLENNDVDIVLMDIVLKGDMDGIDAATIIRNKWDKPIIFLTAYEDDLTISRAKQAEPYGYIMKPFDEKGLSVSLDIAVNKYKSFQKQRETDKKYKSFLEDSPLGIIIIENGKISYANSVASELLGYVNGSILNAELSEVLDIKQLRKFSKSRNARINLKNMNGENMDFDISIISQIHEDFEHYQIIFGNFR